MILENGVKLDFQDVLIRPKRSTLESRKQMNLAREFKTRWSEKAFSFIPIIAANMATGTFEMAEVFVKNNMKVAIHKFYKKEDWLKVSKETLTACIYTIGMSDDELAKFKETRKALHKQGLLDNLEDLWLCIDIANGYTQRFAGFVKKVRDENLHTVIIAGNVCTPEMVQELVLGGADFVKIGIGPGSACTTRMKTGIGYPQISAAIECADAAHGLSAGIILDGGMRTPGDVAKAFVANSDMVMMGGMLSGTDEQEGEIITRKFLSTELDENNNPKITEKKYKIWYGMSSEYAQEKHMSGMKAYRTSEGRKEEVLYIGPVQAVIDDLFGGLRSAGTYIGAKKLKDFGKCGTLLRVNRQHDRF